MVCDFSGREIKTGDMLAYAVRTGSEMWINTIRVTRTQNGRVYGYNRAGRCIMVRNLTTCVVIEPRW